MKISKGVPEIILPGLAFLIKLHKIPDVKSNRILTIILAIILVLVPFGPAPRKIDAASYYIGGRPVPGPLPPSFYASLPPLNVRLNLNYAGSGNRWQTLDFAKPVMCASQKVPVIAYVHGGWWLGGSKTGAIYSMPARLAYQLGFAVVSIEYRLASSTNHHPNLINDCKLAIRYLRANADTLGIDPNRIGIWGGSAGGHLVSLMGTAGDNDGLEGPGLENYSSRPNVVVDQCGIEDLTNPWGSTSRTVIGIFLGCAYNVCTDKAQEASPVYQASPDDPPIMIMHGDHDNVVSYTQAESFARVLKTNGNNGSFIRIVNGSHGFGPYRSGVTVSPNWTVQNRLVISHLARFIEPGLMCDLNMDGKVDQRDADELWTHLGESGFGPNAEPTVESWNPLADLYLDGKIDYRDIQSFCGQIAKPVTVEKKVILPKNSQKIYEFDIELSNNGPLGVGSITLTDSFPKELVFVSSSPQGTLKGNKVIIEGLSLPANSKFTAKILFKLSEGYKQPEEGAILSNSVSISSPDIFNIEDQVTFALPGIRIRKTSKSFNVIEGGLAIFQVTVTNPSARKLTGVEVTDSFPRELVFVSSRPSGAVSNKSVKFEVGDIGPGESRIFVINFKLSRLALAGEGQTITNTASASSNELHAVFSSASIFCPKKEQGGGELNIDIGWKGPDSKGNIAIGEEIGMTMQVTGGSAPYDISIDFGDRTKKSFSLDGERAVEIAHSYSEPGEYAVKVSVSDAYGRSRVVQRKIIVK